MAQPPMFYQRSPDYESNMRTAQALMAQGGSTAPAATPLAALARVVQGGVGGFLQSRERDRDAARQKEYSTVLAQALQASEPWKNPDTSAVRMNGRLMPRRAGAPVAGIWRRARSRKARAASVR
jgi:hypothetical protein